MIDIHCHIIPGVDDGPSKERDALKMLSIAQKSGVKAIIATPHLLQGIDNERIAFCNQMADILPKMAHNFQIEIQVKRGFECYITPEFADEDRDFTMLTLNNNGKYLLIELPMNHIPLWTKDVFRNLKDKGITPIIAHPERNIEINKDPNILYDFISSGCITQLNAGSVLGRYGRKIHQTAEVLLSYRLIHVLASDMHSPSSPMMKDALPPIVSIIGSEEALRMSEEVPYNILKGEDFDRLEPIRYEPKRKNIGSLLWKRRKREI